MAAAERQPPRILCAGIAVLDEVFRVRQVPPIDSKTDASAYISISGGCAANCGDCDFPAWVDAHVLLARLETIKQRTVFLKVLLARILTARAVYADPACRPRYRRSLSTMRVSAPSRRIQTTNCTPLCRAMQQRL